MENKQDKIKRGLLESASLKKRVAEENADTILRIAEEVTRTLKEGGKIIIFGNGGSAADAQHIAAELMGRYLMDREPLPAISLTVNTSSLTAIANDYSYSDVFLRQLKGIARKGDLVWGISTSGNSENVVKALKWAREKGIKTVGFTGEGGGRMKEYCDLIFEVPSKSTPRIQELHITAGHIICEIVEEELFR
ncbi:MAG: D-sedoheptulose 7-phosphate isomerase [Thermoplasmata archaeon]|nr:D-sedoheptulose 7-phosphate isomerase [Thermoplasmata archaeon]